MCQAGGGQGAKNFGFSPGMGDQGEIWFAGPPDRIPREPGPVMGRTNRPGRA
jgi:hypothetical protein